MGKQFKVNFDAAKTEILEWSRSDKDIDRGDVGGGRGGQGSRSGNKKYPVERMVRPLLQQHHSQQPSPSSSVTSTASSVSYKKPSSPSPTRRLPAPPLDVDDQGSFIYCVSSLLRLIKLQRNPLKTNFIKTI